MGGEIGIVNKEAGEEGTCFRFNTYFTVCGLMSYGNARDGDLESQSGNTLSQCGKPWVYNLKKERSHLVLCILNKERRIMIHKFLERLGIKISIVKEHTQLSSTLGRIKQKLVLSFKTSSSGKSDVYMRSEMSNSTSRNSSSKSKDIPLSAMDGVDHVTHVPGSTNTRGNCNFVLILIDTSAAFFHQQSKEVAEFRKDLSNIYVRVVWVDNTRTPNIHVDDLDEPTDMILSKPLHGSRLHQVVKLLPEFGGKMPPLSQGFDKNNTEKLPLDPSSTSSGTASHLKFKSRLSLIQQLPRSKQDADIIEIERSLKGMRILVVEDNETQQKVTKAIFSKLGAKVDLCETGANAIQLVSDNLSGRWKYTTSPIQPYDYILMDCQMEGMDRFEATRRIREEEKNYSAHIPIIALTAHAPEDIKESIRQAGIDHYLPKPLNKDQFLRAIQFLNTRR